MRVLEHVEVFPPFERALSAIRKIGAVGIIGAILAGGVYIAVEHGPIGGGGGGVAGTANLFVDGNGGSCIRAGIRSEYVDARSCETADAAYTAASPGDLVIVKNGSYPDQAIGVASKSGTCRPAAEWQDGTTQTANTSGCITFQPESPDGVTLDNLTVQAPLVYMLGINLSSSTGKGQLKVRYDSSGTCPTPNPIHDIIIEDMSAVGFFTRSMSHTSFIGNTFNHINEGVDDYSNVVGFCNSPAPYQTEYVLFADNLIENVQWTTAGQHIECIHMWGADHMTYERNRFMNCAQFGLNMQGDNGDAKYILIQNNVFDEICAHQYYGGTGGCAATPPGYNSTNGSTGWALSQYPDYPGTDHITVRFNSFSSNDYGVVAVAAGSFSDLHFYGNIAGTWPNAYDHCSRRISQGIVIDSNVWQNQINGLTSCGTNSTLVSGDSSIYTNQKADPGDYSEKVGAPTENVVGAGVARPATDILGHARGSGTTDAGAYDH